MEAAMPEQISFEVPAGLFRFADPWFADPWFADPWFADPWFADPWFADPGFADRGVADPAELASVRTVSGLARGAEPSWLRFRLVIISITVFSVVVLVRLDFFLEFFLDFVLCFSLGGSSCGGSGNQQHRCG
jgi:hypothetical protein